MAGRSDRRYVSHGSSDGPVRLTTTRHAPRFTHAVSCTLQQSERSSLTVNKATCY